MHRSRKSGRNKFSPEEDIVLRKLVEKHGSADWDLISSLMPSRNPRQCRDRWTNYLSPTINHDPITAEEEKKLLRLLYKHGNKWLKIAEMFPDRTDAQLKNHWLVMERREMKEKALSRKLIDEENQSSPLDSPTPPKIQETKIKEPVIPVTIPFPSHTKDGPDFTQWDDRSFTEYISNIW